MFDWSETELGGVDVCVATAGFSKANSLLDGKKTVKINGIEFIKMLSKGRTRSGNKW